MAAREPVLDMFFAEDVVARLDLDKCVGSVAADDTVVDDQGHQRFVAVGEEVVSRWRLVLVRLRSIVEDLHAEKPVSGSVYGASACEEIGGQDREQQRPDVVQQLDDNADKRAAVHGSGR